MAYTPPHRRRKDSPGTQESGHRKLSDLLKTESDDILQAFPQICCMNLDRRTDKWNMMKREAKMNGLPVERFSAVDGDAWIEEDRLLDTNDVVREYVAAAIPELGIKCKSPGPKLLSPSEVGCALSHIHLWRKVSTRAMLVLEDDSQFSNFKGRPRFIKACSKALKLLPDDWGIFYLGLSDRGERSYLDDGSIELARDPLDPNVRLYRPTYGYQTHAYAITKEAAQILLDHLPIKGPIDCWLSDNRWFDIPVYCAVIAGEGWKLEDGTFEGRDLVTQRKWNLKNDIVHSCI